MLIAVSLPELNFHFGSFVREFNFWAVLSDYKRCFWTNSDWKFTV